MRKLQQWLTLQPALARDGARNHCSKCQWNSCISDAVCIPPQMPDMLRMEKDPLLTSEVNKQACEQTLGTAHSYVHAHTESWNGAIIVSLSPSYFQL